MKSSKRWRSLTKKKANSTSKVTWLGSISKQLTREQIRLILRIYWTDRLARKAAGKGCCTLGLYDRLAAEFGVSRRLIRHIADARDNVNKDRFKDISVSHVRKDVRRRLRSRGAAL